MPLRYFEMGDTPEESWRRIRALRAAPPPDMPTSRHKLFVSSLEQAEQQLAAASGIGYESRALNLYYGLSQAGRAIAAAYTPDRQGISPDVMGHGLRLDMVSAKADQILALRVNANGGRDTSFGRLAWLLGSDPLDEGIDLGAVWTMILEVALDMPIGAGARPILVQGAYQSEDEFTVPLADSDAEDDAAPLRSRYPALRPAVLKSREGNGHQVLEDGSKVPFARFEYRNYQRLLPSYRGSPVLMPACSSGRQALDPLLSWWVMLYSLSMLARYKPVVWSDALDVDRSVLAVPLEALLTKALVAVPAQILLSLTRTPSLPVA